MITPLTITSLDQGKELARRHVEKLYAEPAEPVSPVMATPIEVAETATPHLQAPRSARPSFLSWFSSFWDAARPIGAWRH